MYAFSSWLRTAIFLHFGHSSLCSARQEKPLCRAPCTAGIASVKKSLTSDDSNYRNDPGRIMNVWVVPKDFWAGMTALGALQIWVNSWGPRLSWMQPSVGHCPIGSALCVSYHSGQRNANLLFLSLKWKEMVQVLAYKPSRQLELSLKCKTVFYPSAA